MSARDCGQALSSSRTPSALRPIGFERGGAFRRRNARLGGCVAFERFQEQPLGKRLVFMLSAAPSFGHFPDQDRGETDPRIDRAGVRLKRSLKGPMGLFHSANRQRPIIPSPSAHYEVAGIEVDAPFLFDSAACRLYQLEIQLLGEAGGELVP